MTYAEIYEEVKKYIPQEEIEDCRAASGIYIEGMNANQYIPNALMFWLKNGSQIIYIKKVEDRDKDIHSNGYKQAIREILDNFSHSNFERYTDDEWINYNNLTLMLRDITDRMEESVR